jgi:hypothetical protein
MKTEVKRQMDYVYSTAYKEMESRVYSLHRGGAKDIEVRHKEDIIHTPLGAYKGGYKEALKEVAFKIIYPCIMDKIRNDKKMYSGKKYRTYVSDSGQDIYHSFIGYLGRKVGITEVSRYVEEDILTEKMFAEMFDKIIRRARAELKII